MLTRDVCDVCDGAFTEGRFASGRLLCASCWAALPPGKAKAPAKGGTLASAQAAQPRVYFPGSTPPTNFAQLEMWIGGAR